MAFPPSSLPALTDASPATPDAHAADHTAERAALDDIVAELGSNPSGISTDVTARLAALDTLVAGKQTTDSDLTAIGALSPSNGDTIVRAGGVWVNKSAAKDLQLVHGNAGSTETIDVLAAGLHELTLNADCVPTFTTTTALVAGDYAACDVRLVEDATGGWDFGAGNATVISGALANIDQTATTGVTYISVIARWNGSGTTYEIMGPTTAGSLDSDLSTIGALTPTNGDFLYRESGAWTNKTTSQIRALLLDTTTRWCPAAQMDLVTGGATKVAVGPSNQASAVVVAFGNTGVDNTDKAWGGLTVPYGWATARPILLWGGDAAGTAHVYWTVDYIGAFVNDTTNINTATITRGGDSDYATPATAYVMKKEYLSAAVSVTPGSIMGFQVMRRSNQAGDTYTGSALVFAVGLEWVS